MTATYTRTVPTHNGLDTPGLTARSDAARALALLVAHATRPLHDANGPLDDDQVVRAAARVLRGYSTNSRSGAAGRGSLPAGPGHAA